MTVARLVGTTTGSTTLHADEWQRLPAALNELLGVVHRAAGDEPGRRMIGVSHSIVTIPTGYLLTVVVATERENP
jgi:hypothetical protein